MTNRDHIINLCGAAQALVSQTRMMTDQELADIHEMSRVFNRLMEDTRKELIARCKAHGNAGGFILRPVSGAREIKDIRGAFIALRDFIPKDEFLKACSISVTKLSDAYIAAQMQKGTFRDYSSSKQEFTTMLGPVLTSRPDHSLLCKASFFPKNFPSAIQDDDLL